MRNGVGGKRIAGESEGKQATPFTGCDERHHQLSQVPRPSEKPGHNANLHYNSVHHNTTYNAINVTQGILETFDFADLLGRFI